MQKATYQKGQIWKVGELARAAGTTVRTLHHYESIGLLEPKRDPSSGHRIYGAGEVERLQRIMLLTRLGFSLDRIRNLITGPGDLPLLEIIRLHRRQLEHQAQRLDDMLRKLQGLEAVLATGDSPRAEELFSLLEAMMNFEKYYTEEQLEQLRQRREELGDEGMRKGQQDWQDLIKEVQQAQASGVAPDSELGRELAGRWEALIEAFTGGDPGIRESLANAYRDQPGAIEQFGIENSMMEWIGKARAKL